MHHNIPSNLIKLRVLEEIPISTYANIAAPQKVARSTERLSFLKRLRRPEPSEAKDIRPKRVALNVAAWLSFAELPANMVSLWLVYKDESGTSSVLIDEQSIDASKSTMLSGTVTLKFTGTVEYVRACCGGLMDAERFCVDEIFVKREQASLVSALKVG